MLSFFTITHIIREKSDQRRMASMKKSTLTTLLGLLFVMPFSSCEAVPSGSKASLETLASSTSESLLDESFETEGTASSSRGAVSEPKPTLAKLTFTFNKDTLSYAVMLSEAGNKMTYGPVVIPETYNGFPVTKIAKQGFWCEKGPSAVYIPKTIKGIADNAFECSGSSLTSIDVSPDNPKYSSCRGMLFNKDMTELIRCPKGKRNQIWLPADVLALRDHSFYECNLSGLKSLPDSLTTIGDSAFALARNMPSTFVIPDNVTRIGDHAFSGSSLTGLVLGKGVETIGEYAFQNCANLTEFEIPGSVKTIETGTFDSCRSFENVTISSGVKTIGELAFANCTSLISVTISETVSSISQRAFINCSSMEWFLVSPGNPHYCSLHDVLYNKNQTELLRCPENKKRLTIPDTVTTIGDYAFYANKKLTYFVIPDNVTKVGESAFRSCLFLKEVTIGQNVTILDQNSFYGCEALKTLTMNSDVLVEIGSEAFYGSRSLRSVITPDSIARIGTSAFYGCTSLEEFTLGSGAGYIYGNAFRGCNKLVTFNYNGTTNQWASVRKYESPFRGSSVRTINCTNGRVSLAVMEY